MPEMRFHVRWPDGEVESCYSPSTTITNHFVVGSDYPLDVFVETARTALFAANERVRARFGMGCAHAMAQIEMIEQRASQLRHLTDPMVHIIGFE